MTISSLKPKPNGGCASRSAYSPRREVRKGRMSSRGWRNEDPAPRVGRGVVRPKAEKKKVTSPILIAEVVVDVPKGTLDGSTGVRDVFELL